MFFNMRRFFILLLSLLTSLSMVCCASPQKNDKSVEVSENKSSDEKGNFPAKIGENDSFGFYTVKKRRDAKVLVLYYSQFGTTQKLAEATSRILGCDIERFDVENPYNGTYEETIERCKNETEVPKLRPLKSVIDNYDVIILCYPIWFGTYAPPVEALIAVEDFEGKEILPFCTFGSGGLEASVADLRKKLPKALIHDGYGVRSARIDKARGEFPRYFVLADLLEGSVHHDPVYSTQVPVSEEDVRIFDEACGNYPYPIGKPVTVGKKEWPGRTDYLFHVESKDANGNPTKGVVYVNLSKKEGAKAEFIKVVR